VKGADTSGLVVFRYSLVDRLRGRYRRLVARFRLIMAVGKLTSQPRLSFRFAIHSGVHELKPLLARYASVILDAERRDDINAAVRNANPDSVQAILHEADEIYSGRIRLFSRVYFLGEKVDWYKDPQSGYSWPSIPSMDILLVGGRERDADVRLLWELNRMHHLVVLGKAFWYTGETKYARIILEQVRSWSVSNPIGHGPNWACAMEAAIRAVNLLWAYCLIRTWPGLDEGGHRLFASLLQVHGASINANLENAARTRGNHYISDLVGLLHLGVGLPFLRGARRWRNFAIVELKKEIRKQVLDDGFGFEGSTSYHCLVAEMLLHAVATAVKAESSGIVSREGPRVLAMRLFGQSFIRRLELMCEVVATLTEPGGIAPQIGDNDSGRLVRLGHPLGNSNDHRHVLALGGALLERPDLCRSGFEAREEAIWVLGSFPSQEKTPAVIYGSRGFSQSGFYVLRSDQYYMVVHCGPLGTGGRGTHSHNDALGFELSCWGIPFFVDPGTYVYSRDPLLRDTLRSTGSHNTVMLDGLEQNGLPEGDLFALRPSSVCLVKRWESNANEDVFVGEVHQKDRLDRAVVLRRSIRFAKREARWQIRDEVEARGQHSIGWAFHLGFGVRPEIGKDKVVLSATDGHRLVLTFTIPQPLKIEVSPGYFSPQYNELQCSTVLRLSTTIDSQTGGAYSFSVQPIAGGPLPPAGVQTR
jgi:hypothetical protein